jgi:hypothetical protein
LFHSDSSSGAGETVASARQRRALRGVSFAVGALLLVGGAGYASAQTPSTPSTESGQQQGTQPTQPAPAEAPPQIPLQQYPIQIPGRPLITPATPPSTTLPPWTPPVPPPPSQTNVPAPFPYAIPGGAPGAIGGIPSLTIPGAFSPIVTSIRGATFEFHPTARVSEDYSDNFYQTTSRTQENFRTILGPGFTLLLNGARTFGNMATVIDLVHDTAPNSGDDVKVFPSVNLALRYAFTPRFSLTLSDTFIRNDQPGVLDQFGLRSGRRTYDSNVAGLTADWLIGQIATQAYYRNVLFLNENDNQNQVAGTAATNDIDTMTHVLGLNASTRIATNYIVRGGYEFSRSQVLHGGGNGNDQDTTSHTGFASLARQFGLFATAGLSGSYQVQNTDDTRIWNASLFGAYGLPSGLSLSAAVGYSMLSNNQQDNEGAVSYNVNASYRFSRAYVSVGVFQDFRQTAQQGQSFGTVESRSYFGSFLYQLTPFINATAHVAYSENEPTGTGNTSGGGTQTALTYGAGVNWQVLRWLTASLQYTYTKEKGLNAFGSSGTGEFAENRAILSLFATF